mmetsp:Transcript_4365/g.5847  ORF Transcript_4365/g.5847 Transcript_4365/m.5847 type:complete len:449 (+) Transcript_4365:37-1383(+)
MDEARSNPYEIGNEVVPFRIEEWTNDRPNKVVPLDGHQVYIQGVKQPTFKVDREQKQSISGNPTAEYSGKPFETKFTPSTQRGLQPGPQYHAPSTSGVFSLHRQPYSPAALDPLLDSYEHLALTFEDLTQQAKNQLRNINRKRHSSLVVVEHRYSSGDHRPWFISCTALLTLLIFAASMFSNDCPKKSHACVSESLFGRMAFESTDINALYGPRPQTLIDMGAKSTHLILYSGEVWRLLASLYLHSSLVHLLGNLAVLLMYGWRLETLFGAGRIAVVWFLSGTFAMICSGAFLPEEITVGASGAVCGLIGADIAELLHNWTMYDSSFVHLLYLLVGVGLEIFIGFAPFMDNIAHISGCVMGLFLGLVLYVKDRFKEEKAITGPERGLRVRTKLPTRVYQWSFIFCSIPLVTLMYLLAVVLFFAEADVNALCPYCKMLNCMDTWFWSCD